MVAQDKAYAEESNGAAFGPDGRLYTVASDGKLRRYGPGPAFKKEREVATRGGRDALSVAVDPRGQLVAVGINDKPKIDFYDAETLNFRFSADAKGIDRGDLSSVAWSGDGTHLVAAGQYSAQFQGQWKHPLLTFGRDGRRIGGSLPLGADTVQDLQPCGDGIAVATAQPAFGLVDGHNQIGLWKTSVAPLLNDTVDPGALTIAPDARQVRFGLENGVDEPVSFDVIQGTIASTPSQPPEFLGPLLKGLPVEKWLDDDHPTFRGKPIALEQFETSRSLAIRPDRTGFVLGTEFWLRAFDAHGQQRWQQPGPDVTCGVNFSADGRLIVVAYGDGTMRWRRWSDGKELLALFVDRKTKAWVAWTPTGYYMASAGGEDLIGWHLNRGWNQTADFFPASRLRTRFNRPDIVRLVLETLDEDSAVRRANEAAGRKESARPLIEYLPPVVRISSPADGARTTNGSVTLQYAARSPSGQPVERIDVLINGRLVKAIGLLIRTLPPNTEITGSIDVTLTQRVAELGLIAWIGGLASEVATVNVTWDGAPEATRKALCIGCWCQRLRRSRDEAHLCSKRCA